MTDYREAVAAFDFETLVQQTLSGDLTAINACVECCDRHPPDRLALIFEDREGTTRTFTFGDLRDGAARFAAFLSAQGIGRGDCVAGMLPRRPELVVTILGAWRVGAVYQPLFTAFGPKAIEHRVKTAGTRLIVTDQANRGKLADVGDCPPVAVIDGPVATGDIDFHAALASQAPHHDPVMLTGDDPFLMMFTSGTTGTSKGVRVPLKALVSFHGYMTQACDVRADDVYWNIADPGWAYGLFYAVTGALAMGRQTLLYEAPFTAESTYRIIERHGVTNLAGAPTAFRLLLAAGPEAAAAVKGRLRVVSSAGEPLNPEVIRWFAEHLGAPIHDHYGQTEMGMVVCNHHGLEHPVRPGAAGFPMPGYRIVVVGEDLSELPPGQPGVLALDRRASPLAWFEGYLGIETGAFQGDYYLSGDTVELGEDGAIAFVGRSDDVITSAGYRIGPFDVESALIEHPAVMESAVVGKPDPERTEIVKAFVVLKKPQDASPELAETLRRHVRDRLSAHAYPREIEFVAELPKTPSGKVQRFILRNQEVAKAREAAG